MWRAIGVAVSSDGINFKKYTGNPVLTWFPNKYGEEGAVSSGVTLDKDGNVVLYYGANTQESATTVNADGRVAVSPDGLSFQRSWRRTGW
jgi:sucrose-6-phosphate hydrolase SacC (GH32 family)